MTQKKQKLDKDALFNDYIDTAFEITTKFELIFNIDNVRDQFFGQDFTYLTNELPDRSAAKTHVQQSDAWTRLSNLYDYAVDGILDTPNPDEIVETAAEILTFLNGYDISPVDEWENIVRLGDGRFALDEGMNILSEKLALLAGVDIRTVRNAISAGDLRSYKEEGYTYVDNNDARDWLASRRGFKPTRITSTDHVQLDQISTTAEFSAFIKKQRESLGFDLKDKKLKFLHPNIDTRVISNAENGIFKLPLDAVFPLADFYQLEKKSFLNMIMRVFYNDQLAMIKQEA